MLQRLDIGIDWENVNFDDAAALEKVLKSLLVSLSKWRISVQVNFSNFLALQANIYEACSIF